MFSSFFSNVVVGGINIRRFRPFCGTWVGVRHFAADQCPKIHTERVYACFLFWKRPYYRYLWTLLSTQILFYIRQTSTRRDYSCVLALRYSIIPEEGRYTNGKNKIRVLFYKCHTDGPWRGLSNSDKPNVTGKRWSTRLCVNGWCFTTVSIRL